MPTFSHRDMTRERQQYIESNGEEPPSVPPYDRPQTYGDCQKLPRPCPFVGCRHHLYLEAGKSGNLRTLSTELEHMSETCSLDVAARGPQSLDEIGEMMNITKERVRQIEASAFAKVEQSMPTDMKKHIQALSTEGETGYQVHQGFLAAIRFAEDVTESLHAVDQKSGGNDATKSKSPHAPRNGQDFRRAG
jgi:hypothetical protein